MRDWVKILRGIAGRKMPIHVETMVGMLGQIAQFVEDRVNDPAKVGREIRSRVEEIAELQAENRGRAADAVCAMGRVLFQIKAIADRQTWRDVLRELGICDRTARNYIALAQMSARWADLYARLRVLGPTKLYRVAYLDDPGVKGMDPERVFTLPRGQVKLRYMTDRELIQKLRELFPPLRRRYWDVVCAGVRRMDRMLSNGTPPDLPTDREKLLLRNHFTFYGPRVLDRYG